MQKKDETLQNSLASTVAILAQGTIQAVALYKPFAPRGSWLDSWWGSNFRPDSGRLKLTFSTPQFYRFALLESKEKSDRIKASKM